MESNVLKKNINIARMYYPVKTLGPGERIGIWLAGCSRNCKGCISTDFKSETAGRRIEVGRLIEMIKKYFLYDKELFLTQENRFSDLSNKYESGEGKDIFTEKRCGVTISGGEPFIQPVGLNALVREIKKYTEDIIIFTGYLYEELLEKKDENINQILSMTGMLVDGPYIDNLNDGIGMRGSSNQRFIVLNHPEYYDHPEKWKRGIQGAVYGNKIITMGIPDKI